MCKVLITNRFSHCEKSRNKILRMAEKKGFAWLETLFARGGLEWVSFRFRPGAILTFTTSNYVVYSLHKVG
jgi:hypothetical protein